MALRASPTINRIRSRTPFTDFRSPSEYGSPPSPLTLIGFDHGARPDSGLRGFGSRHVDDNAPFNLWDEDKHDFRKATESEIAWITQTFPGVEGIYLNGPTIQIQTSSPPKPVPITIAGVAALFVPPGFVDKSVPITTRYASSRVNDPVPSVKLRRLMKPTPDQVEVIVNALCDLADVKALSFYDYYLIVELEYTDRTYQPNSLPGRVAGLTTFYHHSEEPYWRGCTNQARVRIIDPKLDADAQDTTNYISEVGHICPGVRLSSAPGTDGGGYTTTARSTSAGVLLRNSSEQIRMTAANHGFVQSDEVYHPSENGYRLGLIR